MCLQVIVITIVIFTIYHHTGYPVTSYQNFPILSLTYAKPLLHKFVATILDIYVQAYSSPMCCELNASNINTLLSCMNVQIYLYGKTWKFVNMLKFSIHMTYNQLLMLCNSNNITLLFWNLDYISNCKTDTWLNTRCWSWNHSIMSEVSIAIIRVIIICIDLCNTLLGRQSLKNSYCSIGTIQIVVFSHFVRELLV